MENSDDNEGRINAESQEVPRARMCQINKHTLRLAFRLAEKSVDEITQEINELSIKRDKLCVELGVTQERLNTLAKDRDYRTSHTRELLAAVESNYGVARQAAPDGVNPHYGEKLSPQ